MTGADGIRERLGQDRMQVPHGPGGQSPAVVAPAVLKQLPVEVIEVPGLQASELQLGQGLVEVETENCSVARDSDGPQAPRLTPTEPLLKPPAETQGAASPRSRGLSDSTPGPGRAVAGRTFYLNAISGCRGDRVAAFTAG